MMQKECYFASFFGPLQVIRLLRSLKDHEALASPVCIYPPSPTHYIQKGTASPVPSMGAMGAKVGNEK
jgi:hypothetical protein